MKKNTLLIPLILLMLIPFSTISAQSNKTNESIETIKKTINEVKGIFKKKDKKANAELEVDAKVMNENLVIKSVFGNTKLDANKEILWKYNNGVQLSFEEQEIVSADGQFHTTLSKILYFTDNGIQSAAAIFFTYKYSLGDGKKLQKESCSVCTQPMWGIATFTKQSDNTWKLFNNKILFQTVSELVGAEPEFQLLNLGPNLDVIAFWSSYKDESGFTQSVSYTAINNVYFLNNVFNYETSYEEGSWQASRSQTEGSLYKTITLKSEKNGKVKATEVYNFNIDQGKYIKKVVPKTKTAAPKVAAAKKTKAATTKVTAKATTNKPAPPKTNSAVKKTAVQQME